jgi:homoserine acetyltransferase
MSISGQLAYHMDDLTRHMNQIVKQHTEEGQLAAIIGCSIGGVLALRYGMMFPRDVDQIVSLLLQVVQRRLKLITSADLHRSTRHCISRG